MYVALGKICKICEIFAICAIYAICEHWLFSQRPKEKKTKVEHQVVVATVGVNIHQSFGIALRSNNYGIELQENSAKLWKFCDFV